MAKCLAGNIISDIYNTRLKIIGLKLVNVKKELAEQHYLEHKEKPFFKELIKYLTGELHNNENVIAIVYREKTQLKKLEKLQEQLIRMKQNHILSGENMEKYIQKQNVRKQ